MSSALEAQLRGIKDKKSFLPFRHVIEGVEASSSQQVSVLCWLYVKKGIFMFDTGLGKTIAMIMCMKLLKNANPNARFLLILKRKQMQQTLSEIKALTGFTIVWSNASAKVVKNNLINAQSLKCDIVAITHESLSMVEMQEYLIASCHTYVASFVDEGHNLENFMESDRAYFLSALNSRMSYVASLTATPILTKAVQLVWLMYVTDNQKFKRVDHLNKMIAGNVRLDQKYPLEIYNVDRDTEGIKEVYNTQIIEVEPHSFQLLSTGGNIFTRTRCRGSYNQVNAVIDVIRKNTEKGKKGLVYIHYRESMQFFMEELSKYDVRCSFINGDSSAAEVSKRQGEFNDNQLDILAFSTREALNLDCDYLIFYEFDAYIKQALGRSVRGFNPKVLDLYFLFTKRVGEKEYFASTILVASEIVRGAIGRNYGKFLPSYDQLFNNEGGIL